MPENNDELSEIIRETSAMIDAFSKQMRWAEEEVNAAIERHPADRDVIYHGFPLLWATHELMETEIVFRAHCRELLECLANGSDTRPGTAAEVCCLCYDISLMTPLRSSATGLYFRMWKAAGLPPIDDSGDHHEALEARAIDELEAKSRRALAKKDRRLGKIRCDGKHHGESVQCKFAGQ